MAIPDTASDTSGRWYSAEEVAAHLGVAPDTVYRWIERKGLPAHRVGRLWRCRLAEVDAWVTSCGTEAVRAMAAETTGR
jgi:excisionase family DNA binding protein